MKVIYNESVGYELQLYKTIRREKRRIRGIRHRHAMMSGGRAARKARAGLELSLIHI